MRPTAVVALCLTLCAPSLQAALSGYHIGNSLTVDALPWYLDAFGAQVGDRFAIGCHIRSSASLDYIWDNPLDNDFGTPPEPFGMYGNALPNYPWDYLVLQIHSAMSSTLADDLSAIANFSALLRSNPLNAHTSIYLYTPWPSQPFDPTDPPVTYADLWLRPVADVPTQPTVMSRAYYDLLAQHTGLRQIPVGEIFYELDQRLRAGALPGFSSALDFYRDPVHANAFGRHIALAATYSVVAHRNPAGMVTPEGFPALSQEFYDLVHEVIWQVAALRGDLDCNGAINALDIAPFISALTGAVPSPVLADLNRDGAVNVLDVKPFIAACLYSDSPPPVPEPAGVLWYGLALGAVLSRRGSCPRASPPQP